MFRSESAETAAAHRVVPDPPGATARLAALGIHRIACPLPFAATAGGPVNLYVIEEAGGGVALFDSGLGTDDGVEAVEAGLRALGWRLADVRRVILSHGHVDHYGQARRVAEAAGCPVWIHPLERRKVEAPEEAWEHDRAVAHAFFLRLGADAEAFDLLDMGYRLQMAMARPVGDTQALVPGDTLRFAHFEAEVIHCPGHTPGLVCLFDRQHGVFLANDHLLEKVSPNPLLEPTPPEGEGQRFRALATYLRTLEHTVRLDIDLVLPGHGAPFHGHRGVIDSLLRFYEKRQRRVLDLLAHGPLTGVQVVQGLFPRARLGELYLTLSEAVGNLELLEAQGRVVRHDDGPQFLWERVESAD